MGEQQLVCPKCARAYPPDERFCEDCAMPLVHDADEDRPASRRRQAARKINPQYAEGRLVAVARAHSQPEAEFIAGLLLEEGIPSMVRRAGGFDVAEFLAAGPREVLVPESGAQAAREALDYQREE